MWTRWKVVKTSWISRDWGDFATLPLFCNFVSQWWWRWTRQKVVKKSWISREWRDFATLGRKRNVLFYRRWGLDLTPLVSCIKLPKWKSHISRRFPDVFPTFPTSTIYLAMQKYGGEGGRGKGVMQPQHLAVCINSVVPSDVPLSTSSLSRIFPTLIPHYATIMRLEESEDWHFLIIVLHDLPYFRDLNFVIFRLLLQIRSLG